MLYGTTVKVALTACKELAPVRPGLPGIDEAPTEMNDVKVKLSSIMAGVRLTNSVMVLEMLLGAIMTTFDFRMNESPVLPVPVTVS